MHGDRTGGQTTALINNILVIVALEESLMSILFNYVPNILLRRLARSGELAKAAVFGTGDERRRAAPHTTSPGLTGQCVDRLARVAAAGGDHELATRLLDEAEPLVVQISDPGLRAEVLAKLVGEIAARNRERAEELVAQITSTGLRAGVLTRLAEAAAAGGEHERAEVLVAEISDPGLRAGALAWLAEAAASGGEHDRAARLTAATEALTTQLTSSLHTEVSARLA